MLTLSGRLVRATAKAVGLPEGAGELVDQPTRRRFVVSLLGSVLLSLFDMLGVLAMLPLLQLIAGSPRDSGALGFVSDLLGRPSERWLLVAVAGVVVLSFVAKGIFALVFRRWQLRFMAEQEVALSTRMLDHYLNGPYSWQLAHNTGDKVWAVTSAVAMGYSGGLTASLAAVTEILTITLILVSLAIVSPGVTLAALAYFGVVALLLQRVIRPRVLEASRRTTASGQLTTHVALQALTSGKEIKLRDAADVFVHDFARSRRMGARAGAGAAFLAEVPRYLLEIMFVLGIGLLAFVLALQGSSMDTLVLVGVFAAAGSRIVPSVVRLLAAVNMMRFAQEPLRHLIRERRLLDTARREERRRVVTDRVPQGDITLRQVTFSYPSRPDQPVLEALDLDIPMSGSTAIVGESGAGKSTLIDTLLGLLEPDSGLVTAGGLDIHANLPGWQSQLAVVPQDVVLFDDTLRANIAFEMAEDGARMRDVVERAQLSDLVAQLPEGLDSRVGERGTRLSGGQRQRIGIARALYRRPRVLFLDEATSALDNETERRLSDTINALKGNMTLVIVAHRLSTVRDCDRVVFMADGRVEATGAFDDVRRASAAFDHLVRLGSLTERTRP